MYDFYPEWGPTRHRDQDDSQPAQRRPRYWQSSRTQEPQRAMALAMAGAPEGRDADVDRPDDN